MRICVGACARATGKNCVGACARATGKISAGLPAAVVAASLAAHVLPASPLAGAAHADPSWPPKISATYKLRMAGMELATFEFHSSVTGDTYAVAGTGTMALGLGLFKYNGNFSGSGRVVGDTLQPASYAYDWKSNSKSGSARIAYAGGNVTSVDIAPQPPTSASVPEVVPLKPEHMKAVFDPLASLLVLSRHRDGDPCQRKIAVFEGKQRFDVTMSPLRQEKIVEPKPSGQPVMAHVCKAKYTPIAGHKLNRETQPPVKSEGIEVALRSVPSANILIPYRIVLPTPFGLAVLTAQKVEITAPGNRVIALTH